MNDQTRLSISLSGFEMTREDISKTVDEELDAFSNFIQSELNMARLIPAERAIIKTYLMGKLGVDLIESK